MKIAIAGYGIEGKANYNYWNVDGNELTIVDERRELLDTPEGAALLLGEGVFTKLEDFDMVIRTAGLSPRKISTNGVIWTSTNEFLAKCPAQVIGVTGTKGKGTTSSLIVAMLKEAGFTVHLLGNIGVSPLAALSTIHSDDIVVFEMSSFQLWDADKSPNIAVITPIETDHLDVHDDFEDYVAAKANITRFQSSDNVVVANSENETAQSIAATSLAKQISYPSSEAGHVVNEKFFVGQNEICSIDELKIPGAHNVENTCAALTAVWQLTQDTVALKRGISNFTGLPHRIKLVREINNVRYYDDSYSSAPGAAIAAIRSFVEPEIVILGGYDKGSNFDKLAEEIAGRSNVKKAVLIGQTRNRLAESLRKQAVPDTRMEIIDETDFPLIVARTRELAGPGDVVLLSPGCASFGMFKNFADRGDQFIRIVEAL